MSADSVGSSTHEKIVWVLGASIEICLRFASLTTKTLGFYTIFAIMIVADTIANAIALFRSTYQPKMQNALNLAAGISAGSAASK